MAKSSRTAVKEEQQGVHRHRWACEKNRPNVAHSIFLNINS
jgi:hypothetical protein